MRHIAATTLAFIACFGLLPTVVHAGEEPDAQAIIQQLTPAAKPVATRAWGDPADRGVKLEAPAELPSIDLHILFEFGSADLTEAAKNQLQQLGRALTSNELVQYRFEIAGHTDAVGQAEQNQALSQSRAQTVAHYLSDHYGIEASRLLAKGYGESKLAAADDPNSRVNRRVQIINLGVAP